MVEAALSVVLVGGLVVVALDTVGASTVAQNTLAERGRGQLLASALMSEILQQSYADPNQSPLFGLETLEIASTRIGFDDVDDYDGWSALPPQNKDGTVIPGLTQWRHSVEVVCIDPANLSVTRLTETGVKRITVTVTHDDAVMATLVATRTGTAQEPILEAQIQ